jgi:two-component system OmpR family response regulator
MRILVAEDDLAISEVLAYSLRKAGYEVDAVHDGEAAETALAGGDFDLVILDLGLPRKPGLEVLRGLRRRGSRVPVLVLTALDDVVHRVEGLNAGADDYLQKPFAFAEVEARVRALARRGPGRNSALLALGDLTFDRAERVARVKGEPLELSPREASFLEILLERAGRLVTRQQLAARLGDSSEETAAMTLEVCAQRLRRSLGPAGFGIVAVPALGYSLQKLESTP